MDERHEETLHHRGHTDGQCAHEKVVNVMSHCGNADNPTTRRGTPLSEGL